MNQVCLLNTASCLKTRLSVDLSLYLVADSSCFEDKILFYHKIEQSVQGGVSCIQFRDLQSSYADTVKTALQIKQIIGSKVPLFTNTLDSFSLANEVDAQGVFLERPIALSEARRLAGDKILGATVKSIDDVWKLEGSTDLDYISAKVYASKKTSPSKDVLWNLGGLEAIRKCCSHRIVAIGGITLENAEEIYRILNSDDGIAMAGGIMNQENAFLAAKNILGIRSKFVRKI